jgi:hypothetical protein
MRKAANRRPRCPNLRGSRPQACASSRGNVRGKPRGCLPLPIRITRPWPSTPGGAPRIPRSIPRKSKGGARRLPARPGPTGRPAPALIDSGFGPVAPVRTSNHVSQVCARARRRGIPGQHQPGCPPGPGRLLGPVVPSLSCPRADDRGDRRAVRGQGRRGQSRYRPEPGDGRRVRDPLDPHGPDLPQRTARRSHRRRPASGSLRASPGSCRSSRS